MHIQYAFVAREASAPMPYPLGGSLGESFTAREAGYDLSGSRSDGAAFAVVVCGRRGDEPRFISLRVEIRSLDDRPIVTTADLNFSDGRATSIPSLLKHDLFFVFPIASVPASRSNEYRAAVQMKAEVFRSPWEDAYSFIFGA